jgi:hypothetical protein
MRFGTIMAGALALAACAPAEAQQIRAQDPQTIVKAMQSAGYTANLGKDPTGDPKIESGAAGAKFHVFFFNCTKNSDCRTVQFFAGYRKDGTVDMNQINEWNRTHRFSRAYIDKEGDPVIEMDVNLDEGGLSSALFIDNLKVWENLLGQFREEFGKSG